MQIPTDEADLNRLRIAAQAAMDAHIVSGRHLIAQITRHVAGSAQVSETLGAGRSLRDALVVVGLPEIRPASTEAIADFEHTRHVSRLMMMAVAIAEGASDLELRDLWQISNELVRRTKLEIAELPELEE